MNHKIKVSFIRQAQIELSLPAEELTNLNNLVIQAMEDGGDLYKTLLENPIETLEKSGVSQETYRQIIEMAREMGAPLTPDPNPTITPGPPLEG